MSCSRPSDGAVAALARRQARPTQQSVTIMSTWKRACQYSCSDGVPLRSFYVAIVVGTILNLINQGDALFGAVPVNWFKIALTYCVPYLVCTYGAVSARLTADLRRPGPR
jgi:hypothetical protein